MEKVKELEFGYELYRKTYKVYIKTPDGEMEFVPPVQGKPVFIGLQGRITAKAKDAEERLKEAEELVKQGVGKKYTTEELYRLAFPTEEEFCKAFYGLSHRMKKFVDKIREHRGLIAMYTDVERRHPAAEEILQEAELIETWENPCSPADAEVYKIKNGYYAIEFTVSKGDCFDIVTWIFNQKPSRKTFQILLDLEDVEMKIRYFDYPEEFTCWECGRRVHFLDIEAPNLRERIAYWLDRYCGC